MFGILRLGLQVAKRATVISLIAALVGAGTAIILPVLTGRAIGGVPGLIHHGWTGPYVGILVGLLAALAISNVTGVLGQTGIELADGPIRREILLRIGWALSHDPDLTSLEDPRTADLVQKIRSREWEISMGYQILTAVATRQFPALIGTAITLGIVLTWWAPIPIVIVIAINAEYLRRVITTQMDVWSGQAEGLKHAAYAFEQGMGKAAKEIRIFGLADYLRARMIDFAMEGYRPYWARRWKDAGTSVVLGVIRVITTLGTIAYAAWLAVSGRIDLTTIATAIPLIMAMAETDLWMIGQLQRAGTTYGWLEQLAPARQYLADAGRTAAPITSGDGAPVVIKDRATDSGAATVGATARPAPPAIVFDEVSFHYPGSDRLILDGLNLELPAGEPVALVGVNGAGKSTLVKLLAAGYLPTRGQVLVDGVDLASLEVDERRDWQRRVAPITQEFLRLPLPAGDNVELGSGRVWAGRLDPDPLPDTTTLDAVAERAGITDLIHRLPKGWSTSLDKTMPDGTDLSGGEWQRIGLARALRAVAAGAQVLVLDEPAAALDVESEARLVGGYLDLARSVTSLIISHRFSVVRPVPLIYVLDGGRITERGSHDELMAVPDGRYRAMFTMQASRYAEAEAEVRAATEAGE
ncbi:multidrug ABC transporter permease [Microlunatus endophyticus]|uniref:Multidrug ABC transporter permease n=1 Tax=Microlunatus endophyticus TaxID=1716077 RepID=A0A917W2G8_9ACTN|nr:ABC transporter ATP-binding protein [Microlunatus endophyticus]GGL54999.1 multidrug ABC transporter permease [Microlunatus endophyticus]